MSLGHDNDIYLMELFHGLNELVHVRCLDQCEQYQKVFAVITFTHRMMTFWSTTYHRHNGAEKCISPSDVIAVAMLQQNVVMLV